MLMLSTSLITAEHKLYSNLSSMHVSLFYFLKPSIFCKQECGKGHPLQEPKPVSESTAYCFVKHG